MTPLESKIQSVLDAMHDILSNAVGPNDRREYMRTNNIPGDINWSFSLTPLDIINHRIPSNVIGCTGRAKLFCHLARARCVACNVVAMAELPDLLREQAARQGNTPDNTAIIINGHQIISVDTPDGPRMFDPVTRHLKFWTRRPRIDDVLKFGNQTEYIIRAIVPGDKFISLSSYWELDNLYRNDDTAQQ